MKRCPPSHALVIPIKAAGSRIYQNWKPDYTNSIIVFFVQILFLLRKKTIFIPETDQG